MPRLLPLWTSFAAGEVSSTMYARSDVQKYFSGAQIIQNYHNLAQGGVQRRPGLRRIAAVKTAGSLTIVRRFEFSTTQAYILEFGAGYIRFYKNNAQVLTGATPVELTTPYAAADLYDLDFVQSADVLYILHASYPSRKIERYSDTCWRFRTVTWAPPPTVEYGDRPPGNLEVSAVSGDNVTLTSHTEASFYVADRDREILITAGANAGARVGIKTYTDARHVVGTICEPFLSLAITCTGSWKIGGTIKSAVTPQYKDPIGKATVLTLDMAGGWRGFTPLDTGLYTDTDCGKFALINGGMFEVMNLGGATLANTIIRGTASVATKAESGTWSLEESLWSSTYGYPETGDFFEDRLYLNAGHRICGSKVGDYENFAVGVLDDDAVVYPINSKTINSIRSIIGARRLEIFTAGGEYVATGGPSGPITPTNIQVSSETSYASGGVAPLRIGDVTVFLTRSGKQLREFTVRQDTATDVFVAPDLLLLAKHLTDDAGIVDMAYQREPDSRIWAVRADGTLLCCAYRREENIVAWSRHTTCGTFESVAVVPHPAGDREQVWVTTKRTNSSTGATVRSVEVFDDCAFFYPTLHLDFAMTCNTGSAITTVGVGDYLASQGVKVVADGTVLADATVGATGRLTLATAATKIEVGLPYTSQVTTLRPEVAIGGQSSQTAKIRWAELFVKVLKTVGLRIGTDSDTSFKDISFNSTCSVMDLRLTHLGWDCGVITVQQPQPLPSTILMISGVLDMGGS